MSAGSSEQVEGGRSRATSSVALRPAFISTPSLTRMRSRSLITENNGDTQGEGAQQGAGLLGPSTLKMSTLSSSSKERVSEDAATATSSATTPSFSYFGADDAASTSSDSSYVQTPSTDDDEQFHLLDSIKRTLPVDPLSSLSRLPSLLPQSGSVSRFFNNSVPSQTSPWFAPQPTSKQPQVKRAPSYMALSIPPTPLHHPQELRGEDEDYRLPSPQTQNPEIRFQNMYDGLAARSTSASTSQLQQAATSASSSSSTRHPQTLKQLLPPIAFLSILFLLSLTAIYFAVSTIPLKVPHNISEIKEQSRALRDYSQRGFSEGFHVSAVLSGLFIFKQAFSVPGSILVNILFGSLYGTYAATLCACLFTGVGSVAAYYMARICAPLVERFFPRALATTRSALLSGSASDLFSYLLLARLFPLLPYSVLNVACGVLRIPVKPYFITLVLGSFPYNFVTTQLGDLLGNLASSAESGNLSAIWTPSLMIKLAVASILSAAPIIFKKQLKAIIGGSAAATADASIAMGELTGAEHVRRPTLSDLQDEKRRLALREEEIEQAHLASLPSVRRSRTDSTSSEHLAGRAMPAAYRNSKCSGHQKRWSLFAWEPFRHPRSATGTDSTCTSPTVDEELGDSDEEDARARRSNNSSLYSNASSFDAGMARSPSWESAEAAKNGNLSANPSRRTAIIEGEAPTAYYMPSSAPAQALT